MRKTTRIISYAFTLAVMVVAVLGITGIVDINALLDALTGGPDLILGALAASTIQGEAVSTTNAATASTELLTDDISKNITIMRPDLFPLDTLLRRVGGVENINSMEHEWYTADFRGYTDTLASAFDTSAAGTYASSTGVHTLAVTAVHIWTAHDTILVPEYTDDDGDPLALLVVAKTTAGGLLSVIPLNVADGDLPDMASGSKLVRMGPAKNELDAQTTQYAVLPQKESNFAQIHMKQVEESFYNKTQSKEVKWDINDYKAAAIEDMRRGMEFTSWFGRKDKIADPEANDIKHLSNGITRYITSEYEYTAAPANANTEWLALTKSIFTQNSGSKTRFLFGGSDMMSWIGKVDSVTRQRDSGSVEEMYGITFEKIKTIYGTLMVYYHQLFDDANWSAKGVVLDLNNIERKVRKPMGVTKLELKKSGQRNADAYVLDEAFCLAVRYPETHKILTPA